MLVIFALSACQPATPIAPVDVTVQAPPAAPAARAEAPAPTPAPVKDENGFALSTGTDGTSVKVKTGTTSGGVQTDGNGTAIDLSVDTKK